MFRFILLLLCFGLATGGAALAQSTNPTGAVGLGTPAQTAPSGQPYMLQHGPATGLTPHGQSQPLVMPGGGGAVARSNGNGTTTVTHTNGQVEVVNTPR